MGLSSDFLQCVYLAGMMSIDLRFHSAPVDEPFLRDTINVPYWDGKSPGTRA